MKEYWDRTYKDLARDAGESTSARLSWPRLFKILKVKHEPILGLQDGKLKGLKKKVLAVQEDGTVPYIFDHELCPFCRRAAVETGVREFGPDSAACAACILKGKCSDDTWVPKKIYLALKAGNFGLYRRLIRQGLRDIKKIIEGQEQAKMTA